MSSHPPSLVTGTEGQRAVRQMRGWAVFIGVVVIVSQAAFAGLFWTIQNERHDRLCDIASAIDQQRDIILAASGSAEPPTPDRQKSIDRYNADTDALIERVAPSDCRRRLMSKED